VISRRSFLTLASGLLVPYEAGRVYSFLPAWRLVSRWVFDNGYITDGALVMVDPVLTDGLFRSPRHTHPLWETDPGTNVISPENVLDVKKSAEAYGLTLRWA